MSEGARTVTCARCGSAVLLRALAARESCPFCRAEIELCPSDRDALTRYGAEVRQALDAAHRHVRHAQGWNRYYGGADARRKHNPFIAVVILLAIVLPFSGLSLAVQALGWSDSTAAVLLPTAFFGIVSLVLGGYFYWYFTGRSGTTMTPGIGAAAVRCPQCGAPHELAPGEVLERCPYCSATLLPDPTAMAHGRDAADRALLRAEIERARAERRGMVVLSGSSAANATPYLVIGSFLPITALGAIVFTVSWLAGDESDTRPEALALLWAIAATNLGLLGLVRVYRRARVAQLERAARALLARFGGTELNDPWAVNAWLDRHWAGSVPLTQLFRGPYYLGAACSVAGYPVLFVANPVGVSDDYPAFLSLRVGGWIPDREGSPQPAIAAAESALRALGFDLVIARAGLTAVALRRDARRALDPAKGPALADAVELLGNVARTLGGRPVDLPP